MNNDINSIEEIKTTDLWDLYQRGVDYNKTAQLYEKTNKCWRFFHGDQWKGLKSDSVEPVTYPIIEPIVNYKVATINQNLWNIHYSSENFDNIEAREIFKQACDLLNKRAARVWERDQLDYKIRLASRDSAVVGEGVMYVKWDEETQDPTNEILDNTDICFGNENSSDIQSQPYIIIKLRRPVSEVRELAKEQGVDDIKLLYIVGDQEYNEQSGENATREVNDMTLVLIKLYKKDGTVHFERATKHVVINEDEDTGLKLYPLAHMIWKETKGYSRGVGEVEYTIPIQIEINKTLMRRCLIVKMFAYPKAVVNAKMIKNYRDADKVGVTLRTDDASVDDVRKAFSYTTPAAMSTDVHQLQDEMITKTRELKNASELATGNVNPENASGRAILAVQQASNLPLNEHTLSIKTFIEDLGRIFLDMWTTYAENGLDVINEKKANGKVIEEMSNIGQIVLEQLKASCKVDITPKSPYDKMAEEQSLENLLKSQLISLDEYVNALDDDSVMPKQKLQEILKTRQEKESEIQQMKLQANNLINSANRVVDTADQMNQVQTTAM